MLNNTCAWYGTIREFTEIEQNKWLSDLKTYHRTYLNEEANQSQITAWQNCFDKLQEALNSATFAAEWAIIFEYELPRERGRRPDVLILTESVMFVLEFKDFAKARQAHIDQVSAYARDLQHYHKSSHHLKIIPLVLLTVAKDFEVYYEEVKAISIDKLARILEGFSDLKPYPNPIEWLKSDYEPLPTLVRAAQTLFQDEPLPQIRRAHSAGIPDTIAELFRIADQAKSREELHLVLITGVPGAGKTLVGLQFVYEYEQRFGHRDAVFLSGNGPLVKVLQYALKNKIFVQDVHGFLKTYGGDSQKFPSEKIWIYDEAQRAWDAERVKEKRGHNASEPKDFLRIGEHSNSWGMLIGLIGEGQEIHIGEEAGIPGWNEALSEMSKAWRVHYPPGLEGFLNASTIVESNVSKHLTLNQSLRTHLAEDVQYWIKALLEGDIEQAAQIASRIHQQGFNMYVTADLEAAKGYVRERYAGQVDKRYGLLASSKAIFDPKYGIKNEYQFTKNFREGPWYVDSVDSPKSSCGLQEVATEFSCQGLELDFPIVCWGNDLIWKEGNWYSKPQPRSMAKDPHQLRLNSYRVLLSRGRDGFIVFLPKKPMDETGSILEKAGLIRRGG